jgi:hypothetical protein
MQNPLAYAADEIVGIVYVIPERSPEYVVPFWNYIHLLSQVAPYCTRTTQVMYLTYRFIHVMRKYHSKIIVARIRVAQLWLHARHR